MEVKFLSVHPNKQSEAVMLIRFDMETGIKKKSSCRWVKIGDLSCVQCEQRSPAHMHVCIFWKFGVLNYTITLS